MKNCVRLLYMGALAIAVAGCSGGNDGGNDGGQTKCGDHTCAASQNCINDTVCVPRATQAAKACEEDHDNIYKELGPAELGCHNSEPCSLDGDCPTDASGTGLSCHNGFCGVPAPTTAGLPETVTFSGCVDAFGLGDTTHQMKVALYRANQDPTGSSNWDMATTEDKTNCEYWGAFEFANVPTNTPLILKTYDDQGDFVVTYKYNLILWADLAVDSGGGNWVFDTRTSMADPRTGQDIPLQPWRGFAISQTTYSVILMSVGITLPPDNGAIAGTIRDCGYHELANVRCGSFAEPEVMTYFTNAEDPRPDHSRDSTNLNGIFAAISIPQGTHKLSCLAEDASGNQVPLGEYSVKIFPHAITILSFDWYPGTL
ncbi:MAG TPA: hypothetical protein VM425_16920 [Myxococcota bacterium]|nr:hypothetical protein [Myxococcota bacterium]